MLLGDRSWLIPLHTLHRHIVTGPLLHAFALVALREPLTSRPSSSPVTVAGPEMSLDVALQSVAFYILSCSTCAKINHRRKAKTLAKRERAEKHALETEQPGLYRHPSPFSTNPYWDEEITMGPGPPKKKAEKNTSQGALNTTVLESGYANSYAMSTETASSPTAVESRTSGEGWNRKRYQREDEALWGHDTPGPGQRIFDAIARAGSTAGRLLEARLNKGVPSEEEKPGPYYLAKNPPVNDLHPPVVSTQPASRDETRWMLQPPPPAKVMEGKERVNRTRAVSAGSSRRGPDGSPLSRPVTGRLDDVKEQPIEALPTLDPSVISSWQKSGAGSSPLRGQSHQRSTSPTPGSSGSDGSLDRRRKQPRPNVSIPPAAVPPETTPYIPSSKAMKENEGPPVLREITPRELSSRSSNSAINLRPSSAPNKLMPNANSMPVTIPNVKSKFPGTPTSVFPKPTAVGNNEQTSRG